MIYTEQFAVIVHFPSKDHQRGIYDSHYAASRIVDLLLERMDKEGRHYPVSLEKVMTTKTANEETVRRRQLLKVEPGIEKT